MKFSILGVDITLSRKSNHSLLPTLKDVQDVNKEIINYIRGLSGEEKGSRVECLAYSLVNEKDQAKECLAKNGIVVVPDFVPEHIMGEVGADLQEIRDRVFAFKKSDKRILEESDVLFQKGTEKLSGYQALSTYEKTVVQVREGQDSGMIDIFNVDKWQPSLGKLLRPYFEQSVISELMEAEGGGGNLALET